MLKNWAHPVTTGCRRLFASTISQTALEANQITIQRNDEAKLVMQPWSQKPFLSELQVPIFNFKTGVFTGQVATLD
jgi:hypothetical protein